MKYCSAECRGKVKYSTPRHQKLKTKAVNYKGGKCQACGYNTCIAALDFHHLDRLDKDNNISKLGMRSWEKLVIELDKCILLCANCHRELHSCEAYGIPQ